MKKLLFSIALLCALISAEAATYIRYNLAGFDPGYAKIFTVLSDEDLAGQSFTVTDAEESVALQGAVGASISSAGTHSPFAYHFEVDASAIVVEGDYTLTVNGESVQFKVAPLPASYLTSSILRYFRVQRSGSSDALDHGLSHTGDTSCAVKVRNGADNTDWVVDAGSDPVDMMGGWYDAGDYLKFTLTTAYSAYFILRSYETYPALFDGQKQYSQTALIDILDEAKWGLDYLMKTMPEEGKFIIQTGDVEDHNQGYRMPEDDLLDGQRHAYTALSKPQMGYTAAALALGAKIFRAKGYTVEADSYQAKAIAIYAAAKASTEDIAWFAGEGQVFYSDQTADDNLLLAAAELFLLTDNPAYELDAQGFSAAAGAGYWASWGNINMTAQARIVNDYPSAITPLRGDISSFYTISAGADNPFGVPHNYTWATLYSMITVANGAMSYEELAADDQYQRMAVDVFDYVLGRNNWGVPMIATEGLPFNAPSVENVYSQYYTIQTNLFPEGAIAEGPGDKVSHDALGLSPETAPWETFNTADVIFYDDEHDYMTMETTIGGLADGLYLLTKYAKMYATSDPVFFWKNIDLGADRSLCGGDDGTVIEPGLTTDGITTFEWKLNNTTVLGPSTTDSVLFADQPGTYTLVLDSIGEYSAEASLVLSDAPQPVAIPSQSHLCSPVSFVWETEGNPLMTYDWTRNGVELGSDSSSVLIDQAGTYSVTVSGVNCSATSQQWKVTSGLLSVEGGFGCVGENVVISTSDEGDFEWYDAPSGGELIGLGSSVTVRQDVSTTYYVQDISGGTISVGPVDKGAGWYSLSSENLYRNAFEVLTAVRLESVKVYTGNAQTLVISLTKNGLIEYSDTSTVGAGTHVVELGWNIAPGSYELSPNGSTGQLWVDDPFGETYPLNYSDVIQINMLNAPWGTSPTWYGNFYDWQVTVGNTCDATPVHVGVGKCLAIDCAGVENGTAIVDSCGTCAGGTTGITPVTDPSECLTTVVEQIGGVSGTHYLLYNAMGQLVRMADDNWLSVPSGVYIKRYADRNEKVFIPNR